MRVTRKRNGKKASGPEGTIQSGWVIKNATNGVPRWVRQESVELNGFRLLTLDYVARHIGHPITLHCREFKDTWPSKTAWRPNRDATHYKLTFTPTGNARVGAKVLEGWVRSRRPPVKAGSLFYIDGPVLQGKELLTDGVQLDSREGRILSTNFMNTEIFVLADSS